MLTALLGDGKRPESLKRLIIERTQGNPFFMEEMVRALVEQGVLVRNGAMKLTKPLTEMHVPPTVQASWPHASTAAGVREGAAADPGGHRTRISA